MSKRILAWTDEAWGSYIYWQRCDPASTKGARERATRKTQDKKTLKRINKLIEAALRIL